MEPQSKSYGKLHNLLTEFGNSRIGVLWGHTQCAFPWFVAIKLIKEDAFFVADPWMGRTLYLKSNNKWLFVGGSILSQRP